MKIDESEVDIFIGQLVDYLTKDGYQKHPSSIVDGTSLKFDNGKILFEYSYDKSILSRLITELSVIKSVQIAVDVTVCYESNIDILFTGNVMLDFYNEYHGKSRRNQDRFTTIVFPVVSKNGGYKKHLDSILKETDRMLIEQKEKGDILSKATDEFASILKKMFGG